MKKKRIIIMALLVSMVVSCFSHVGLYSNAIQTVDYPVPQEGVPYSEQTPEDQVVNYNRLLVYLQPVTKQEGVPVEEAYTVYNHGYFPEFFNATAFDQQALLWEEPVLDVTFNNVYNPPYYDVEVGEVFYPVYQITYTDKVSNESEGKELLDRLNDRPDVFFATPLTKKLKQYWLSDLDNQWSPDIRPGDPIPWYKEYVGYVLENQMMNGFTPDYDYESDAPYYSDFSPSGTVSRAQVAQVFYNIDGATADVQLPFFDIGEKWYLDAVEWVYGAGVMNGVSEDVFAPEEAVTREQFVTVLYRYAKNFGYNTDIRIPTDTMDSILDFDEVSDYAKEAFSWAVNSGYLDFKYFAAGGCLLAPQEVLGRAEMAKILTRFFSFNSVYAPESGMSEEEFYSMIHG